MKIIDVLQKTESLFDETETIWIFVVDDVAQKYIDMTYEIDECDYFKGNGLEIECVTCNGKVVQKYEVHLQYYFDDYENIAVVNDDAEIIKCIEDFISKIGNTLPFSEGMGQLEYSEMIQGLLAK